MPVRKIAVVLCIILLPLLFMRPQGATAPVEESPESMLRLHVRANSNSPADQALKYQVRDAVLAVMQDHVEKSGSLEQARAEVETVLPTVLAAADSVVDNAGYNYQVSASLGEADFPTRLYGDQVYRAGTYQAVQIYLGEGSGENWWCVLFPPLCFVEVSDDSVIPVSGDRAQTPRPRSRLLEWWQNLFGGRS
ncbi:stage II sporulation protein R [Dethiobacter alkaliphilus]|uniref:Stage II sporulation protein R n=1 Tax=Dethiobacter alkaliphilus AHT 1 TaxID=555088 RepID=C0GGE9_DETAL|nr:stage II sporulation protein R [Dethiobacter alkaliphilus]EEG77579.1 stage II sporulation protein R [Dethiobacter alkaliphilus AHT 1]